MIKNRDLFLLGIATLLLFVFSSVSDSIVIMRFPCMKGTYRLAWDGDYPGDTDAACDDNYAKVNGTVNGSLALGKSYGDSDENSVGLEADDASEQLEWADASDNHIDGAGDHTFWIKCYISAAPAVDVTVLTASDGSAVNYMKVDIDSDRSIETRWIGGSSGDTHSTNSDLVPATTWTTIGYAVDNTNNNHSVKVGANSWVDETSVTIPDMTADVTEILFGTDADPGGTDYIRCDRAAIVTGYKQGPPTGW